MSTRTPARTEPWLLVAVGAFLVLVGLGTLASAPWRYAAGGSVVAVAALQIVGSLSAVVIGAGAAWLGAVGAREKR
ncbi:hypothetical protein C5B91_07100 [Haloferax sp. Atlit-10N]|uniref:hypothetical protein n=1 Tax=Haloferax TaxID=2251 RepID=UPI0006778917|nr:MULTISPECIES: hypothetical protein [Haloferax]RDZ45224.1 hypothetical protein C5B87_13870 [Haloferax sp. Atlit-16N]RDZ48588.1 hypothetical protein C5B86_06010 [Haloferax sp. Atlit-19N]RDZ58999.1 hypothetical protein C5B91_07100 [Haloferax sp. Atlit-10N]